MYHVLILQSTIETMATIERAHFNIVNSKNFFHRIPTFKLQLSLYFIIKSNKSILQIHKMLN